MTIDYYLIEIDATGLPLKLGPYANAPTQKATARLMMTAGKIVLWLDIQDGVPTTGVFTTADGPRQRVRVTVQF